MCITIDKIRKSKEAKLYVKLFEVVDDKLRGFYQNNYTYATERVPQPKIPIELIANPSNNHNNMVCSGYHMLDVDPKDLEIEDDTIYYTKDNNVFFSIAYKCEAWLVLVPMGTNYGQKGIEVVAETFILQQPVEIRKIKHQGVKQ